MRDFVLRIIFKKLLSQLPFADVTKRSCMIADTVNHSSGVAVVKMTKDNIFHTIFDKEIMKGLTTQKSIKALKIRVIVKKIFVRNKMHS